MRMTNFLVYKIRIAEQTPRGCQEVPFDDIA